MTAQKGPVATGYLRLCFFVGMNGIVDNTNSNNRSGGNNSNNRPDPLYETMLDLELDDWLDPSLPRMYRHPPIPFRIGDDFTPENRAFRTTQMFPPAFGAWVDGVGRVPF